MERVSIDCKKYQWLANWLLAPDSSNFSGQTHMHEIIFTHNKHKSSTHSHTHTHTYFQSQLSPFRRRSEPSTAQFRNFYGKSSLIKFNELWKRQQISRGQLCCQSLSSLIFLMSRRHSRTRECESREGLAFLASIWLRCVVNCRMWFLWVGIIKCGIKSVGYMEVWKSNKCSQLAGCRRNCCIRTSASTSSGLVCHNT